MKLLDKVKVYINIGELIKNSKPQNFISLAVFKTKKTFDFIMLNYIFEQGGTSLLIGCQ
jgi:hypothetical protein